MEKFMIDCLKESPGVCSKLVKAKDTANDLVDYYLSVNPSSLILVGSGSSNNIAQCSKLALKKYLGVDVTIYTPVEFANYEADHHQGALVACLSQSGRSTNTIEAIEASKAHGYATVGMTMVPNSPLTGHCDHVFVYGSYTNEKDSFVCRGFSASVTYFIIFALKVALKQGRLKEAEYNKLLKELQTVIDTMPKMHELVEKFYQSNKHDLYEARRNMVMGIGNSLGIASEATLKYSETTGIPTNGYEIEEFLHGPAYEVKKDHALFFYDIDEKTHDRAITIYEASKELVDRTYIFSRFVNYGNQGVYCPINGVEETFLPVLFVIPIQMLPGRICEDLGIRAVTICNYRASQIAVTKTDK